MRPLLIASALVVGLLLGSSAAGPLHVPYHAFCRTLWLFGMPCADVRTKLVRQIQAFSPARGCDKCHYTLDSFTVDHVQAHHASADSLHLESIELTLRTTQLTASCSVSAQSASVTPSITLLDGGLNYCNLYDLLTASDLISAPGFMEVTDDWACLGYKSATCKA